MRLMPKRAAIFWALVSDLRWGLLWFYIRQKSKEFTRIFFLLLLLCPFHRSISGWFSSILFYSTLFHFQVHFALSPLTTSDSRISSINVKQELSVQKNSREQIYLRKNWQNVQRYKLLAERKRQTECSEKRAVMAVKKVH